MGEPATISTEKPVSKHPSPENPSKTHFLPTYHHNGRLVTKGIHPEGESGRAGFHPYHFIRVIWHSSTKVNKWLNLLWPFVPAAIALYFATERTRLIFAFSFIGIVPAASTLDFAGQEFARKLPRVIGIVTETFFGGIVELVLFMILIAKHDEHHNNIPVIKAAILGSMLANLLLCLGGCFLVGGLKNKEQRFHKVISEVGSGILLVAGFGLLIPSAFFSALQSSAQQGGSEGAEGGEGREVYSLEQLASDTSGISKGTAVVLMIAFFLYMTYNIYSHDSIFDEVLNHDEERDRDRAKDRAKSKLTMTEAVIAIVVSLTLVTFMAYFLVAEIESMVVDYGLRENFLGLILVPVVEKAAEHLSALDEAYDNQINFALFHCLSPTIQTALFNAPLVIFVAWGIDKPMDLNFEIFMIVLLVLAIIVVGSVLRDGSSDYLEGSLLVLVYVIIAIAAYHYPDVTVATTNSSVVDPAESTNTTEHAVRLAKRLMEAGFTLRDL